MLRTCPGLCPKLYFCKPIEIIMSQNQDKRRQTGLYDDMENPEDDFITFEMAKVPLQDFVSSMRKSAVHAWKDAKALSDKVQSEVTKFVSSTRTKAHDQFKSIGITNPALAMQVGAVGSAGLFGLLLARKRSTFRRILYPTLAGGSVWAAFYLSSASNRTETWSKFREMKKGYYTSIAKYKRKNSEQSTEKKR